MFTQLYRHVCHIMNTVLHTVLLISLEHNSDKIMPHTLHTAISCHVCSNSHQIHHLLHCHDKTCTCQRQCIYRGMREPVAISGYSIVLIDLYHKCTKTTLLFFYSLLYQELVQGLKPVWQGIHCSSISYLILSPDGRNRTHL